MLDADEDAVAVHGGPDACGGDVDVGVAAVVGHTEGESGAIRLETARDQVEPRRQREPIALSPDDAPLGLERRQPRLGDIPLFPC